MRKYLSLIFKGLGILSLVIAVGIFVVEFFILSEGLPLYDEKLDRCESHYCISIGPKGSEKFKDCVSDCMEKMGFIYNAGVPVFALILLPGGIIFFIVLGIILLVISAFSRAKWE